MCINILTLILRTSLMIKGKSRNDINTVSHHQVSNSMKYYLTTGYSLYLQYNESFQFS